MICLPVVCTPVGGLPEAVVVGKNGFVVPAGDAASLHAAITRMIDDEPMRSRCAAARLELANGVFAPERNVRALLAASRSTCANRVGV